MPNREERRPEGLFAYLFGELGRAVQDIRQRVVEEGWFGRPTTPLQREYRPTGEPERDGLRRGDVSPERPITFEDFWPRHEGPDGRAPDLGHDIDRGIDR